MNEMNNVIIQEIAQNEEIENARLVLLSHKDKCDEQFGQIKFGKIVGTNKFLYVILKCSTIDNQLLDGITTELYKNEIWFYKIVLPAFQTLQIEFNISEPFDNTVKFYGNIHDRLSETIVLENILVSGYEWWDWKLHLNDEHLACAFQALAKFHGTSFAMQRCKPHLYSEITQGISKRIFRAFQLKMRLWKQVQDILDDLGPKMFDADDEGTYLSKLQSLSVCDHMEEAFAYNAKTVIIQGDCWCTNVLYKYGKALEYDVPEAMKMMDFHLMQLASPVLDLSFFFYGSASKNCVDNLEDFLLEYHNALTAHLAEFGINARDIFSYDDLYIHWTTVAKFGLFMAVAARKLMLIDEDDATDLGIDPKSFLINVKLSEEKQTLYCEELRDLFIHFIDNHFI